MHIKVIHPLQTHRTRISRKNIAYIIAKRDKNCLLSMLCAIYTCILIYLYLLYTYIRLLYITCYDKIQFSSVQ